MKSSSRLILALALFAAPLFTHAELIGSPSSPTPQDQTAQAPDQSPQAQAPDSSFVPLAPIPGLTEGVVANSQGLANFLNNLYKYLIGVAAVLAVIVIIRGGIEISVQESIPLKLVGKQRIYNALYGLVLVLSPALVFGIINPSILDLNFAKSLKPLDIHNRTVTQSQNGSNQSINGGSSGTPTGTYLIKLTTADKTAQQNFIDSCQPPDKLFNTCTTVDSQTGKPNCSGSTTLECQKHSPKDFIFLGFYDPSFSLKAFFAQFTSSTLYPAVTAEVPEATKFINTCSADGGSVCTTDGTVLFETYGALGGDNISCPPDNQQPSYSQTTGYIKYCEKSSNLFCMDPSNNDNGCNSYFKFSPSQ